MLRAALRAVLWHDVRRPCGIFVASNFGFETFVVALNFVFCGVGCGIFLCFVAFVLPQYLDISVMTNHHFRYLLVDYLVSNQHVYV